MLKRPAACLLAALVSAALVVTASRPAQATAASHLPSRLADQEFWSLAEDLSELGGTFRSDNLLSNESRLQFVIPDLLKTVARGGAYVGVGPEQNFTYIAALQPSIAFIVDIRRGNLQLHLMYKALFELSADRAEFVSRLFSQASGRIDLDAASTPAEIFEAYANTAPSEALYDENLKAIEDQLAGVHGFALVGRRPPRHRARLPRVLRVRSRHQLLVQRNGQRRTSATRPTYADLMVATDAAGDARSYLASEESFAILKALQAQNLIVPVVGDFAGRRPSGPWAPI